jgi:hypothetical protein
VLLLCAIDVAAPSASSTAVERCLSSRHVAHAPSLTRATGPCSPQAAAPRVTHQEMASSAPRHREHLPITGKLRLSSDPVVADMRTMSTHPTSVTNRPAPRTYSLHHHHRFPSTAASFMSSLLIRRLGHPPVPPSHP